MEYIWKPGYLIQTKNKYLKLNHFNASGSSSQCKITVQQYETVFLLLILQLNSLKDQYIEKNIIKPSYQRKAHMED